MILIDQTRRVKLCECMFCSSSEIDAMEQLGSEIVLDTRVGDLDMTIDRVGPQLPRAVGETVRLSAPSDRLHFFIGKPVPQFDNTDCRTGNAARGRH